MLLSGYWILGHVHYFSITIDATIHILTLESIVSKGCVVYGTKCSTLYNKYIVPIEYIVKFTLTLKENGYQTSVIPI